MSAVGSAIRPDTVSLAPTSVVHSDRQLSLDVVRGITVAAMLVVNNPGSWSHVYPQLRHSAWDGCTFTDVVFPVFLFVAGAAMTYSVDAGLRRGVSRGLLLRRMAVRAVILFALGLLLHAFPWWRAHISTLRIPGVLQRIALAVMLASPAVLWLRARGQALVAALLLIGYWLLMKHIAAPGGDVGLLVPGRDLGAYIDRTLLGLNHLAHDGHGGDPAGLLGTVPAGASVLLGALTGRWMRSTHAPHWKSVAMVGAGAAGLALGQLWGRGFPINKSLWTSSYVVYTSGWAALLMGVCYWVVDVRNSRRWIGPFVRFGRHALLVYVLSELGSHAIDPSGARSAAYHLLLRASASPPRASLAYALSYACGWALLLAWIERVKVQARA